MHAILCECLYKIERSLLQDTICTIEFSMEKHRFELENCNNHFEMILVLFLHDLVLQSSALPKDLTVNNL